MLCGHMVMVDRSCVRLLNDYNDLKYGAVVEWLGNGLQNRLHRFDPGRRL